MWLSAWIVATLAWVGTVSLIFVPADVLGIQPALAASIAMMIAMVVTGGAAYINNLTHRARDDEEIAFLPRAVGVIATGCGLGLILCWPGVLLVMIGAVLLIGGALLFLSPAMLKRSRQRRHDRDDRARATGGAANGVVVEAHLFVRNDTRYYRCTIEFTDHTGTQRWIKRTAPSEVYGVQQGEKVQVHYDSARPEHRRSIVIDWPARKY